MGIRDTSFYERALLRTSSPNDVFTQAAGHKISNAFFDVSGNFYSLEYGYNFTSISGSQFSAIVLKKSVDSGQSWSDIKIISGTYDQRSSQGCITDSSGNIFIAYTARTGSSAGFFVEKSSDFGSTWNTVLTNYNVDASLAVIPNTFLFDVGINDRNKDHLCVVGGNSFIYSINHGSTWQSQSLPFSNGTNTLKCSPVSGSVYIAGGNSPDAITYGTFIYSASYNASSLAYNNFASLFNQTLVGFLGNYECASLYFDSRGYIYSFQLSSSDGSPANKLNFLTSSDGKNFGINRTVVSGNYTFSPQMFVDRNNKVFSVYGISSSIVDYSVNTGSSWFQWGDEDINLFDAGRNGGKFNSPQFFMIKNTSVAYSELYLVSLNATSSSLGPRSFATSIGYPNAILQGHTSEILKLNNISEFPHSAGFFQMKNIALGSQNIGKIGHSDTNVISVNHVGSVVNVMWPKQNSDAASVTFQQFGDASAGQKPGALTTAFTDGDYTFVDGYDSLCLYCYLVKQSVGTVDDIEIQIKRRPLRDLSFATEQAVEFESSGSVVYQDMKDLIIRKTIDYSDLSIKEISWPIDVDLKNVKDIAVSARLKNGQALENSNLIIWGRFIKSKEEV